jgi:hypothetical protein
MRSVHIADSRADFVAFIGARGLDVDRLGPREAVGLMCDWYEVRRADGTNIASNGDMLLFQWGTFSWNGGAFSYDLTRQFLLDDEDGDDAIFQLHLTLLFDATDESISIGSDDRWCDEPSGLAEFRSFVESSAATTLVSSQQPTGTRLTFEQV